MREIESAAQRPEIRQLLADAAEGLTQVEEERLKGEKADLQKTLTHLQERSKRRLDGLGRGLIDDEAFSEANGDLKREPHDVDARRGEIASQLANRQQRQVWAKRVQELVLQFPLCREHASFDERREILSNLIEKLTVEREGRDAVICLKLHLLPERTFFISFQKARNTVDRPVGVEGLTQRQMALLYYVGQGKSVKETAVSMGTSVACIYQFCLQVRRYLGVRDLKECYIYWPVSGSSNSCLLCPSAQPEIARYAHSQCLK